MSFKVETHQGEAIHKPGQGITFASMLIGAYTIIFYSSISMWASLIGLITTIIAVWSYFATRKTKPTNKVGTGSTAFAILSLIISLVGLVAAFTLCTVLVGKGIMV